eukprot:1157728-Pelagomonas_calceolata.AAC.6
MRTTGHCIYLARGVRSSGPPTPWQSKLFDRVNYTFNTALQFREVPPENPLLGFGQFSQAMPESEEYLSYMNQSKLNTQGAMALRPV